LAGENRNIAVAVDFQSLKKIDLDLQTLLKKLEIFLVLERLFV
jgi:hypothetical protein